MSPSTLKSAFLASIIAVSLAVPATAASLPLVPSRRAAALQSRTTVMEELPEQPRRLLPPAVRRFIVWLLNEIEIPHP
jgi:hypothetical protein